MLNIVSITQLEEDMSFISILYSTYIYELKINFRITN
jgi:hypothetical protein